MEKKLIICDTDVIIDYWNKTSHRHVQTKNIIENAIGFDNIVVSAISRMELLMGASNKEDEAIIKKKILRFNTALINNEITKEAIRLFENYRLSHGLAIPDCIIAATSRITEFELFTYNIKDYRFIPQLMLYNPN